LKYFIDTEFMESPCTIELISIGIFAENSRTFYAESNEFDPHKANPWVQKHVFPQLKYDPFNEKIRFGFSMCEDEFSIEMLGNKNEIQQEILRFIGTDKPEFWGYYSAYDWVVFCWLFGPMIALPDGWPMYCRDLKQLADSMPEKPRFAEPKGEHNALIDAAWNKDFYYYLMD